MRRQSRVLRFCRVCHAPPGPVLAVRSQDFEVSAFGQAQAAHAQRARVTAASTPRCRHRRRTLKFASLVCVSSPWLAPSRPSREGAVRRAVCRLRARTYHMCMCLCMLVK